LDHHARGNNFIKSNLKKKYDPQFLASLIYNIEKISNEREKILQKSNKKYI